MGGFDLRKDMEVENFALYLGNTLFYLHLHFAFLCFLWTISSL